MDERAVHLSLYALLAQTGSAPAAPAAAVSVAPTLPAAVASTAAAAAATAAAAAAAAPESRATHERLLALLAGRSGAPFTRLTHAPTRTSQESANVRGATLASGAKAMLLRASRAPLPGGKLFCLAVMSAAVKAELGRLKKLLGVKDLSLATEAEVLAVTGCVPGAVPPFGSLFSGVLTVVDASLSAQGATINFNAGLRTESVGMGVADYLRIEAPHLPTANFSTPMA